MLVRRTTTLQCKQLWHWSSAAARLQSRRVIAAVATNTRVAEAEVAVIDQPVDEEIVRLQTVTSELFPESPRQPKSNVKKLNPAQMDAQLFTLDPSVNTWCNPIEAQAMQSDTALSDILRRVAASAASNSQAAIYWSYHTARFSFFVTQAAAGLFAHLASQRLYGSSRSGSSADSNEQPFARLLSNVGPEIQMRLLEAYRTWEQDLAWIQAGKYKMPWDMVTPNKQYNPLVMVSKTAQFMQEGAATLNRRVREKAEPVWLQSKLYPQYYTKTFHYQSDGWFSDWSAGIYEHSTETLFMGRQDAMQRAALVPISDYITSSRVPASGMRLLEVAAGTGRFHTFIKDNWPEMRSVCSDLSPFYLQRARQNMQEWKSLRKPNLWLGGVDNTGVEFVQMAAEKLDAPDASYDIVVCVYLFHEMPEAVRRKAVAEWYRVLKPGGLCVFADSGQLGDRPEWDHSMGRFGDFNEPWYVNFINCDFGTMFKEAGFKPDKKYLSSATKVLSFVKPL